MMLPAASCHVCADVARRNVVITMTTEADPGRVTTKARVNSLLRMLKEDDGRILIRARWPNRSSGVEAYLKSLRDNPSLLENEGIKDPPSRFEVVFTKSLGANFSRPKNFVTELEALVMEFYDIVAVNLKPHRLPDPPKPVRASTDDEASEKLDTLVKEIIIEQMEKLV